MLAQLNPNHGVEVWINKTMEGEIEKTFKDFLKTETLNYYYVDFRTEKGAVKWLGNVSLIQYIKKIQKKNANFSALGVTNAKNKATLEKYFEDNRNLHLEETENGVKDYWIGDTEKQSVVCGDELFVGLWNRIKSKATKKAS